MMRRIKIEVVFIAISAVGILLCLALIAVQDARADAFEDLSWSYESCDWDPLIWASEIDIDGQIVTRDELEPMWEESTRGCLEPGLIGHPEWRGRWGFATMRTLDVALELRDAYLILRLSDHGLIDGYWWGYMDDGDTQYAAEIGQGADIASTLIGVLGFGAVELNPMGLPLLVSLKLAAPQIAKALPYRQCVEWRAGLARMGIGPGAANVATLGGAGLGAIVAGAAAYGYAGQWAENSAELSCLQAEW